MKKMNKKQYRQGDVFIELTTTLPKTAKRVEAKRLVLAEGEVTGHAHVCDCPTAELYEDGGIKYLVIPKKAQAPVVHEEHATITLPPGIYTVEPQFENTPEELKRVAD